MSDPATVRTNRPWHRFRFTLRTLLVVLTVLACWFGWNANTVRHRRAHRVGQAAGLRDRHQTGHFAKTGRSEFGRG